MHGLTNCLTLDHLIQAMQMLCPYTCPNKVFAVSCDPFKMSALLCARSEVTALCYSLQSYSNASAVSLPDPNLFLCSLSVLTIAIL